MPSCSRRCGREVGDRRAGAAVGVHLVEPQRRLARTARAANAMRVAVPRHGWDRGRRPAAGRPQPREQAARGARAAAAPDPRPAERRRAAGRRPARRRRSRSGRRRPRPAHPDHRARPRIGVESRRVPIACSRSIACQRANTQYAGISSRSPLSASTPWHLSTEALGLRVGATAEVLEQRAAAVLDAATAARGRAQVLGQQPAVVRDRLDSSASIRRDIS